MSRVTGGILGFVVGGGLAFLALNLALDLSDIGAEDVKQYLLLFFGLWVGLFGSVIGAGIGIVIGEKADDSSSPDSLTKRPLEEKLCPNCGCRVGEGAETCEWCGAGLE